MAEILIARTYAEGLRPLGAAAQRNHALITETLAGRLSPAHASMFSEPSPTPDGAAIDWYAQIEGPVRRLDELGAEEAKVVRARIGELTRDVLGLADELDSMGGEAHRRLAEALRNALEVPDGGAVWLVGDQPVLVTWAHSRDIDKAPRGVIRRMIPAKPVPVPTSAPVVAVERSVPWDIFWWLGWLLLAILMFWALYLLIAPCGLRGPAFLNFDSCPRADAGPRPLDAEAERRGALEDRIAALERNLVLAGGACVPQAASAEEPKEPDKAVLEEGGEIGKVNVILSWQDRSDLDLAVVCPSSEKIYHANKTACGGELDIDANMNESTPKPVENVVFAEPPQRGTYEVQVRLHAQKEEQGRPSHPFAVTIIVDGRKTVHNATVSRRNSTWTVNFDYGGGR